MSHWKNHSLVILGFSEYHLKCAVNKFPNKKILFKLANHLSGFSINTDSIKTNYLDKGKGYNLFIHSASNGTGKTTLLHKAAIVLWQNKFKLGLKFPYMFFDQISSVFKRVKDHMFQGEEFNILQMLVDVDVLFIDDLDKAGTLTEFEMENFRLVIDSRYRSMKPMFLTANMSLEQLESEKIIDSAIYSRLLETCTVIQINDKDHRVKIDKSSSLDEFK